ncbi:hypothetical protein Goari_018890 [Gossypium aridum]|uniref:DUF674 family protein n=1 Tax=Gossypium aridum TaxID=34290 RepID=A0A7J8WS33_GOSAI|nr:hypothetical protein [Gossypium aridum]
MSMASEDSTTVSIKLLIDQESSKVIIAEVGSDIVDVLRSLLKFPLGNIARLIGKHQCFQRAGCLNNLYNSVENLSPTSFRTCACKSMLLNPRSIYEDKYSKKLKLNMDVSNAVTDESEGEPMLFFITDDLRVMQALPGNLINFLLKLSIYDVCQIEEKVVDISSNEMSNLLSHSLISKTTLTDVFLRKQTTMFVETVHARSSKYERDNRKRSKTRVKITLRKSDRKILYGEANEDFVDLLFSFLTIPLESALELLGDKGNLTVGSIYNLFWCRRLLY